MRSIIVGFVFSLVVILQCEGADAPRKVLLIAGKKSHGPEGNRVHDYPWSVKLLKVALDNSSISNRLAVEFHRDGWPADERVFDGADTIVVISDGRDGDAYTEALHLENAARVAQVDKLMKRGCGLVLIHFSTFAPDSLSEKILDWAGGYFDWEEDGKKKWYSAIKTLDAEVQLSNRSHPVLNGVAPFKMREEFYYNLRFNEADSRLKPLLSVPELGGRAANGNVVGWAVERADGGRGFGTTCGHFYDNWKNDSFRRTILNAIAWTAKADVPVAGVQSKYHERDSVARALTHVVGSQRAKLDDEAIRVLMFAGNEAHRWHNWEKTTPRIRSALERDARMRVEVSGDIEDLARKDLKSYQLILQNYANWHDPRALSPQSRKAFWDYVQGGGGLLLVHFANGAFHFSLPNAAASDWPEYRQLVRRVWNHQPAGKMPASGHDSFGSFTVEFTSEKNPISAGLDKFIVEDELYFNQHGDEPIQPLAKARSKVTGREEPLAWSYSVGKGRVYQTLLGHSEKTYDAFETREMIRRAAAWCAGRLVYQMDRSEDPSPPSASLPEKTSALAAGKFGKALNAQAGGILLQGKAEYRQAPITIEAWVKISRKDNYNIIVASDAKSSGRHWELFTFAGSGQLTGYLPGMVPDHVRSEANVCDDQWHHVAMTVEAARIRLFMDGKQVADQPVKTKGTQAVDGGLAIGRLVEGGIGFAGLIDEVMIRRGIHPPVGKAETAPKADASTLGYWEFESLPEQAPLILQPILKNPTNDPTLQTEGDWVDDRWAKTDKGPFLTGNIATARQHTSKGIAIRIGEIGEGTVCFDTDLLRMNSGWVGGFLKTDPARFGLIRPLVPVGTTTFATRSRPGWAKGSVFEDPRAVKFGPLPRDWARYSGLHLQGNRVTLEYTVNGVRVLDSPWLEKAGKHEVITRELEVAASDKTMTIELCDEPGSELISETLDGVALNNFKSKGFILSVAHVGAGKVQVIDSALRFVIDPHAESVRLKFFFWKGPPANLDGFAAMVKASPAPADLVKRIEPGIRRWGEPLLTRGTLGSAVNGFAIDTVTLPVTNQWKANLFVGGHDFLANGDALVGTIHGDVWLARGVDARLERIAWQRFATGLYQPLGLKVVDGKAHVLGRDQITILHDRNGDGEADFYENFNNEIMIAGGGHSYATSLETDASGNFYFVRCAEDTPHGGVLLKVPRNGKGIDVVATGFRNPNGMGLGPDGTITVADQQGNWVPETRLDQIRSGGFYGYMPMHKRPVEPTDYDKPLCWIPRTVDNSAGGQVWVPRDSWGALAGQMIHLSYGRCTMMLVVRDELSGAQGGVVQLPGKFLSGAMRGRFHPKDGHLYVSGLNGWQTAAVADGCLQRVRFTGETTPLPVGLAVHSNGIKLTFSKPIDRDTANDPDNWSAEQWNYRWAKEYGSKDWSVKDPAVQGRDAVTIKSAKLLADGRSVFLEIPGIQPVMSMTLRYNLDTADGKIFKGDFHLTVNRLGTPNKFQ